jgi:hypothetical protein
VPKPARTRRLLPVWLLVLACIVALGGGGAWYWWQPRLSALSPGITKANGRLEAEQVEIATKFAGRIAVVLAKDGNSAAARWGLGGVAIRDARRDCHNAALDGLREHLILHSPDRAAILSARSLILI